MCPRYVVKTLVCESLVSPTPSLRLEGLIFCQSDVSFVLYLVVVVCRGFFLHVAYEHIWLLLFFWCYFLRLRGFVQKFT